MDLLNLHLNVLYFHINGALYCQTLNNLASFNISEFLRSRQTVGDKWNTVGQ